MPSANGQRACAICGRRFRAAKRDRLRCDRCLLVDFVPSPGEIRATCWAIQDGWSEAEREKRSQCYSRFDTWSVPVCGIGK